MWLFISPLFFFSLKLCFVESWQLSRGAAMNLQLENQPGETAKPAAHSSSQALKDAGVWERRRSLPSRAALLSWTRARENGSDCPESGLGWSPLTVRLTQCHARWGCRDHKEPLCGRSVSSLSSQRGRAAHFLDWSETFLSFCPSTVKALILMRNCDRTVELKLDPWELLV